METSVGFEQKVGTLKSLENYCYRIAHFVLQDEALAADAAIMALLAMGQDPDFFRETPAVQKEITKRMTIRTSLQVKYREPSLH